MYKRHKQKPKKARKKPKYKFKIKKPDSIQDSYQSLPYHPLVQEIKKAYLKD